MGLATLLPLLLALQISNCYTVDKNLAGSGCVDLLCPETAQHYGVQNLVNEESLKTESCTSCSQCTENGYSVCLRARDSRASRTAGGCSCSHQLAQNCHNDLTQTVHPANLTMRLFSACYTDALQRPPKPLGVNENSSVVITIEPFWLEPYWRHLRVENLTLFYQFLVSSPDHCEGRVESTDHGVHTCLASVHVDLNNDGVKQEDVANIVADDEEYEHSDNYDQYDDDLPPEVQFDRDVFSGAKSMESYFTANVRRARQLNINAMKSQQIFDHVSVVESDRLKFDLKPEVYGNEVDEVSMVENDDSATSEEMGGTNFFEEAEIPKVNLEDIEPKNGVEKDPEESENTTKNAEELEEKSEDEDPQEAEEKDLEESEKDLEESKKDQEESEKDQEESEKDLEESEKDLEESKKDLEESEKDLDESKKDLEESEKDLDESEKDLEESEKDLEESEKDLEESEKDLNAESTTVELIEGEEEVTEDFLTRITESFDFPRVRLVFLFTLALFICFILAALCVFYRQRYCGCCCKQGSKTANGYRYTSANGATELVKPLSRGVSCSEDQQKLLADGEIFENFRSIVKLATTFNPTKVELGISVGMGKFGPIHRATFNSYNGSVHDVNVYLLKNVTRLAEDQINELSALLKSNVLAGSHPNVISLCGITQSGGDVMLMWEPLHQPTLQGVLRESRCARFGSEPFNFASFLSSERLATMAIGCCTGLEHLLKRNVYPMHISTSNVLVAERGIVKIGGFGLAEHHALNISSESTPTSFRWWPPEYFKKQMVLNEQTMIWSIGVILWEIFSLGGTPFATIRHPRTFVDSMRDGSAGLDTISYCGEAVTQLLSTCTSHTIDARGDIRTIIKRLECISADAKTQINLSYREDFPYLPIVTQLEQQEMMEN